MFTPPPESCRKVQGSRQEDAYITSELRTDKVGCAGNAPDIAHMSAGENRNKSGTAEVFAPLSLSVEAKAHFLIL